MINIDTRLINALNGDELAIFCHILKRINKNNESFPSRSTLMKDTEYGRDKVAKSLQGLKDKGIITYFQKKKNNGLFAKTYYKILTDLAGVYINVKGKVLEENRDTENRATENPYADNPQLSINHNLSINHKKYNFLDCKLIFDYWNEQKGLIKHKELTPERIKRINQAIKNIGIENLKRSIFNYSKILNNSDYYFNHRWDINTFLIKQKGKSMYNYNRFLKEGDIAQSYLLHFSINKNKSIPIKNRTDNIKNY